MTQVDDPGTLPSPHPPSATEARRRRRQIVRAVLALALLTVSGLTARLFVWPELPPLPDHADAVVQLGGPGDRRGLALDMVDQGRAPIVAISVTSELMRTSWCRAGRMDDVPIMCFSPEPFTTRGEARAIADMAQEYGWHSVILVTSTDQAWRAMVRVSRCFDGQISVATARLPLHRWPAQVVYQWGATVKAFTYETGC